MADNVSVVFSAQIGQLISGVEQVKDAITSIGDSATKLAAVLGVAFSIEGIEAFVGQMSELGAHIERASNVLGISTTNVQELGIVARATGGDADSLARTIGLLQRNLETAQSGVGPTALALKALGLNAKELAALPIPEQIEKIADAFNKYADGGHKAALANELVRGGAENLLPAIEGGAAGFDKLRQAAIDNGTVMTGQTIRTLDDLSVKTTLAKSALTALGGTLVAITPGLGTFASGVATTAGHLTALGSTGNLSAYVLGYLDEVVDNLGFRFVALGHAIANLSTLNFAHLASDWARDEAALLANAKDEGAQLDTILNRSIESYKKLLAATTTDNRPQAPGSGAPNKDAINASMAAAQEQIKLADEVYRQQAEKYSTELKLHVITESEKTSATLAALDARHTAELAAISKEQQIGGLSAAQYQKITNEKEQADQKWAADRQKIIDQSMEQEAAAWNKAFTSIEGAFNSQLKGLLAGTTTWGNAMKAIFGDLIIKGIEMVEKLAGEWIAGEIAKTAATTAGVAARTAAETAGSSTSVLAQIGNAVAVIGADAAKTFAGVFAFLSPTLGPAAAGPAAASGAVVEAAAAGVPSMDVGGYVLQSGLAMVHQGEVIPAAQVSQPYAGGAGGGASININGSVMGTQAWTNSMIQQIARALTTYQSRTPSTSWA